MNEHVTDHLSDYLDGELAPAERADLDAHLRRCEACARDLEALRRIVAHAATLPDRDAAPARELWTGIHARIGTIHQPRTASRRVSLSIPQLAAAAVLLMAASATAVWLLLDPRQAVPPRSAVVVAEVEPSAPRTDTRVVNFADAQFDAAVSDLERALHERRNDLNPRTVEILERNLQLIDAAIAQARQALEEDPGNTYLNRHLVDARRRKLDLLRRATAITEGD